MIVNFGSRISKFRFSINWSPQTEQTINSLRLQVKKNSNFIKQNKFQVMNYLQDLFDNRSYSTVIKLYREFDLQTIDEWRLWQQLGLTITSTLEKVDNQDPKSLNQMLIALNLVKYQINQRYNPEVTKAIKTIIQNRPVNQILTISTNALSLLPGLFQIIKPELEGKLLNLAKENHLLKQDIYYTIIQGCFSSFWSDSFKQQLVRICHQNQKLIHSKQLKKLLKYISCSTQTSVMIEKSTKSKPSLTQTKIGLMLSDLGYIFDRNLLINDFEVDILFQELKLVVEYNGMKHYKIPNVKTSEIQSNFVQKWRVRYLEKRGFHVCGIPFFDWEKYDHEKTQRAYLIQVIEQFILQKYIHKKQSQIQ